MIEPIVIKVTDKVPELVSKPKEGITCANSDYTVVWQLDEEWAQLESRTMQVNYKDGTYERVLFTGDSCALPAIPVKDWFYVGLFAGDIHTTRPVKLFANRAITTDSGEERDPTPDGYAQAIQALDGKLDKNQGAENAGKAMVVGEDGNVVPGKAQDSSLPAMSADTKGKMLTNDGEKAEWGEVPKEVMVVNFTEDDDGNWSADKSWDDVATFIENGSYVYAVNDIDVYSMYMYSPPEDGDQEPGVIRFFAVYTSRDGAEEFDLSLYSNGTVEYGEVRLQAVSYGEQQYLAASQKAQARANIGLTPVAKTDAMTQSVGLDAETGELYTAPAAGDNTLGITSATVGQIAKITAVDDSGKPTAWEAVDMAGGGEETWEVLQDVMITADESQQTPNVTYSVSDDGVYSFSFDKDMNGNDFSIDGLRVFGIIAGKKAAEISLLRGNPLSNIAVAAFRNLVQTTSRAIQFDVKKVGDQYYTDGFFGTQYAANGLTLPVNYIVNNYGFVGDFSRVLSSVPTAEPITKITLQPSSDTTIGLSGRLIFYRKRG